MRQDRAELRSSARGLFLPPPSPRILSIQPRQGAFYEKTPARVGIQTPTAPRYCRGSARGRPHIGETAPNPAAGRPGSLVAMCMLLPGMPAYSDGYMYVHAQNSDSSRAKNERPPLQRLTACSAVNPSLHRSPPSKGVAGSSSKEAQTLDARPARLPRAGPKVIFARTPNAGQIKSPAPARFCAGRLLRFRSPPVALSSALLFHFDGIVELPAFQLRVALENPAKCHVAHLVLRGQLPLGRTIAHSPLRLSRAALSPAKLPHL